MMINIVCTVHTNLSSNLYAATAVEDLAHQIFSTKLVDRINSVEQIASEHSSRGTRRSSIGRAEPRRQTGPSAASPSASPVVRCEIS